MLSPVVMFVYNRLPHAQKTLQSLAKNTLAKDTYLYIFSDAAKSEKDKKAVEDVRKYINSEEIRLFFRKVIVIEAKENKGLAKAIISGVSKVISKYNRVIVIEDDNLVAPDFLEFMNDCLDFYEKDSKVWSISSYNIMDAKGIFPKDKYEKDIYMLGRTGSYSWASWKDRWEKVDWDVKDYKKKFLHNINNRKRFNFFGNDRATMLDFQMAGLISSWAIRFDYAEFKNQAFTIYPSVSKSKNIGLDGSGVHNKKIANEDYKLEELNSHSYQLQHDLYIDEEIRKAFISCFNSSKKARIKQYIKAYFYRIIR